MASGERCWVSTGTCGAKCIAYDEEAAEKDCAILSLEGMIAALWADFAECYCASLEEMGPR